MFTLKNKWNRFRKALQAWLLTMRLCRIMFHSIIVYGVYVIALTCSFALMVSGNFIVGIIGWFCLFGIICSEIKDDLYYAKKFYPEYFE